MRRQRRLVQLSKLWIDGTCRELPLFARHKFSESVKLRTAAPGVSSKCGWASPERAPRWAEQQTTTLRKVPAMPRSLRPELQRRRICPPGNSPR